MCIRDRQSTMYNNSPVTEPNTNNWDTLNAKNNGQRVVYGQDIAYAKYKSHLKVIVMPKN